MFSIQNKSGKHISISDLGLVLAPRQCIDLDSVVDRYVSDRSHCLKKAVEGGHVKILRKDVELKKIVVENKTEDSGAIKLEIEKMKNDIMKMLASGLSNRVVEKEIIIREGSGSAISSNEPEIEADKEVLAKLHEKTMEKMLKNTELNIHNISSEIKNSELKSKLDELEGLI